MKHPVHPCDEIRGVGQHHERVALESIENLGDPMNRHPVAEIEPDAVKASDVARSTLIHFLRRFCHLEVLERETVMLRLWGLEWDAIAAKLNIESFQLAEWTFTRALRKNPDLKTLFPKTNRNNLRVRAR